MATTPPPSSQPTTPTAPYNQALMNAVTQPGYINGVSTYAPATYGASTAQYDPAQWFKAKGGQLSPELLNSLSPNATIAQLQQSMVPQTQQAFGQLQQQLADFGVQGGQGIMAGQQLSGQLEGSIAPAMAAAIQNAQANELGAGQFDVGQLNAMRQFNAGQHNQMDLANSENALQAVLANAGFQNQAGQFNAEQTNAAGQYAANAQNSANQYNVGEQNAYNQAMMNAILGNYANQEQMFGGILGQGQSALDQQALNYGQDITQNPGVFGMLGGLAGAALPFFTGGFGGGGGGGYGQNVFGPGGFNIGGVGY